MKNFNCFTKIFWILIFSALFNIYNIYASDELTQDSSTEEPDEASWIDPDEEQELNVLPTKPIENEEGEEEKIGFTLNLPVIGNVVCYSNKDPKTGEEILKATLPGKSINLSPVPIYFDNFELIIPKDKNPSINATVILFGKRAKLELLEAKKESAFKETPIKTKAGKKIDAPSVAISLLRLRIIFEDKPALSFFPGKSIDLNHIDLLMEIGKIPSLGTEINMFGQSVNVQFGFTKQSATIDFSLPSTQFSNIIPFVKNTPLATANLKSVIISAKYLFAKYGVKEPSTEQKIASNTSESDTKEELKTAAESKDIGSPASLSLAISAQADFSAIIDNDLKKYINLNDLTINAVYSQAEGFHMESAIKNFDVPLVGNVSEAKLIVDWSEKSEELEEPGNASSEKSIAEIKEKPKLIENSKMTEPENALEDNTDKKTGPQLTISITGTGAFNIPISGLGQLKYTLNSEYINNEFVFGGKINESFAYSSINIASEATFIANITKKSLAITGNTNLNGLDLIAKFVVAQDDKTKETVVSATATAKASNWQPLTKVEGLNFLPNELKDITVKNLDASFITEKKAGKDLTLNLIVKGLTNIMNVDVNAQINFIKNDNQTGVFIKANVPANKLPSALEKMQIKDASFVLSTIAYQDPDSKTQYTKGLNLAGEFDFTGDLESIGKLLHIEHLNIVGTIDPTDITKSKFSVQLPGIINTGTDVVSFGPLSLEVTAQPSFDLVAEVTVKPDKDQSLRFTGSAGVKAAAIGMELSMFGLWKNPFHLISDNFAIGNGHLGFNITFPPPLFNPAFSAFSLAGETELSKTKTQDIKFALKIDLLKPQNLALLGSLDGKLTLEEFISFIVCKVIKQKINLDDVPDISMEDIKISFAPMDTEIGALKVEQGITLKGMVGLFGEQIAIDFEIKRTGAKAQADMSPINLGPLHVTSGITAKGGKRETKLGGPSVDIELSTARQQFLVSGMLEISNIFSVTSDIYISRSGIEFNFETEIGPRNLNLFKGKVRGFSEGPLLNPDFNLHIEMQQHFIEFMKTQITDRLDIAQKEVQDKINKAISNINSIDKQIAGTKASIDNATKTVEEWKNKVNALERQINSKKKELSYYKSKISGGSIWGDAIGKLNDAGHAIGNIARGISITTGAMSKQAINEAKNLINKGINEAEKQADRVVYSAKIIELGSEIAALEGAKGSALLTLKGFQLMLDKIVKVAAVGTLEASKRASQGILTGVRNASVKVLKAGEWTVKSLADGFNIKKAVFDGSLQKIKDGQLLGMLFEITILGSDHNIEFNFDFKDVKKSASDLAQYIVNNMIPGI